MAKITDIPTAVTGAGQPFDYTNPPTLASVALVNAPLDPDHLNIGLNRAAYDTYIDAEIAAGRAYTATGINLQNPAHPLVLPIPFESSAYFYNYGRVNIGGVNWYIFYDAEYMNKTSTRFIADIDEAASYNWQLGYSPIERGHVAVAAAQNDPYGAEYLTAPEPVDAAPARGVLSANMLGNAFTGYTALVISANDLRGSNGSFFADHVQTTNIDGAANLASSATVNSKAVVQTTVPTANYPWAYNAGTANFGVSVPLVTSSPVSTIDGVSAGGGAYLFTLNGLAEYLTIMQGAPWVLSGIAAIRLVPTWAIGVGGDASFTPQIPSLDPTSTSWAAASAIPRFVANVVSQPATPTVLAGWRASALAAVGATGWTKLVTSQFTEIQVGDGESLQSYSPDQWQTTSLQFNAVTGAAHGEPSIRLTPIGYNLLSNQTGVQTPTGGSTGLAHTGFGQAASNTAAQDLAPFLAAYSTQTTWRTMLANKQLATSLGITRVTMGLGLQGVETALGGVTAALSGGLAGGPLGAVAGIAGTASSIGGLVTSAISAQNTITLLDVSQDGSFDIGAYQLGISGLATVDTFNTWFQSLYSTPGGGRPHQITSAWRSLLDQAFSAIITMPTADGVRRAVSMWKRYGYMVGRTFKPSRLDVMSQMSYWKTNGAVITGALPQRNRQTMAQAFDRGLTVWSSVAAIGTDVTNTNTPTAGISY